VGVAAGEAIGPYGAITRRYVVPFSEVRPERPATTYRPYFVTQPEVAVIGRNNRTGLQVWSADWGYPGDFDYREFHKKDGVSGLQYWRVSGAGVDLADKDAYHPDWAAGKVESHADHFSRLVTDLLGSHPAGPAEFGIISANYDTELFGHWWFEGIRWLEAVLRRLAVSETVELTTASDYILAYPPETVIHLPEGSWGAGGGHFTWDNADTHWMWPLIHQAESRMREVVNRHPDASGTPRLALDQAARELLLLQSSDWPFLVSTGQAREYAVERFRTHLERFESLVSSVESGTPDPGLVESLWERDKVFPEIDYRWFQA
jgi:1,4-alpha-glucan branching enzyme